MGQQSVVAYNAALGFHLVPTQEAIRHFTVVQNNVESTQSFVKLLGMVQQKTFLCFQIEFETDIQENYNLS